LREYALLRSGPDYNGDGMFDAEDVAAAQRVLELTAKFGMYLSQEEMAGLVKAFDVNQDNEFNEADIAELQKKLEEVQAVNDFAKALQSNGDDIDGNKYFASADKLLAGQNYETALAVAPYLNAATVAVLDRNKDGALDANDAVLEQARIAQRMIEQQDAFRLALVEFRKNYGSTLGVNFSIEALETLEQAGPHDSVVPTVFRVTAVKKGRKFAYQVRTVNYPPVSGQSASVYEIGDLSSPGRVNAYRWNRRSYVMAYQYIDDKFYCKWTQLCWEW